jgi:hypothetical protein
LRLAWLNMGRWLLVVSKSKSLNVTFIKLV